MAESGDPSIVAIPHCPSLRPLEPETTPARVYKLSRRFATTKLACGMQELLGTPSDHADARCDGSRGGEKLLGPRNQRGRARGRVDLAMDRSEAYGFLERHAPTF